ncbi:MAG TPA: hypothetical protein VKZ75_05100 [Cyclobacteriaceae bacterium]|nr:hypothetical protein [Cyclobacteriaceae bacterium]
MVRFLISLVILALLISGCLFGALRLGWIDQAPSYYVEILIFVFLTTLILFTYLYRAAPGPHFVQFYLLTMVLKLLGYAAFGLIIILSDRDGAASNAVLFIITYFAFTALEVVFLYRKIRGQNNPR